jgi:hypothetical protein
LPARDYQIKGISFVWDHRAVPWRMTPVCKTSGHTGARPSTPTDFNYCGGARILGQRIHRWVPGVEPGGPDRTGVPISGAACWAERIRSAVRRRVRQLIQLDKGHVCRSCGVRWICWSWTGPLLYKNHPALWFTLEALASDFAEESSLSGPTPNHAGELWRLWDFFEALGREARMGLRKVHRYGTPLNRAGRSRTVPPRRCWDQWSCAAARRVLLGCRR